MRMYFTAAWENVPLVAMIKPPSQSVRQPNDVVLDGVYALKQYYSCPQFCYRCFLYMRIFFSAARENVPPVAVIKPPSQSVHQPNYVVLMSLRLITILQLVTIILLGNLLYSCPRECPTCSRNQAPVPECTSAKRCCPRWIGVEGWC